jgi:hypothetical protein
VLQTVEVEVTRLVEITPTPPPTPTPTLPPPLILQEDFEAGQGEWYTASDAQGSARVADGRLILTARQPNSIFTTGHPDLDFLNTAFDLTVSLTNEAGPRDSFAAIRFRYFDDANSADLTVDADGFVSMGITLDGEGYLLIPWTRPSPIPRQPFCLRLIDTGTRVTAYLNDSLLFDMPLEDLRLGGVYFFVGAFNEAPSTWAFDDIQLRELVR